MKNMNFVPNFVVHNALGATAAGQTDVEGGAVDVSASGESSGAGADCVAAIVRMGTMVDNATGSIRMQESDSSGSGFTDVPNARVNFTSPSSSSQSDHSYVVEIVKPTKRYARVVVNRATQNSTIVGGHYVLGGLRYTQGSPDFHYPDTTHVASGVSGEDTNTHTSPGTAL